MKVQWKADDTDGSFRIEWYERIVDGNPMDRGPFSGIAIEISPDERDAGRVGDGRTERRNFSGFPAHETRLSETSELCPGTGPFRAVPAEARDADFIAALLARVQDCPEGALSGNQSCFRLRAK